MLHMQSFVLGVWSALLIYPPHSLQQASDVRVQNLCRRWGHQTCVIDGRLYLDGGRISPGPDFENNIIQSNTKLVYEDFTNSASFSGNFPAQYNNLSKLDNVPSLEGGVLWPDSVNKVFYLYGGRYPEDERPYPFKLWRYDTITDTWSPVEGTPSYINGAYYGAGVTVQDRGWSYYVGGWLSNASVPGWAGPPVALDRMLKYDMLENSWTNNTMHGHPARAEGVLLYIPASDQGMLVYFGGIEQRSNGTFAMAPMDQIHLYDIGADLWYTQSTTGEAPQPRRRFCAGVAWSEDQSSYNIYLYGGLDELGQGWEEAYTLSLPSFQWVLVYPSVTHNASWQGKGMTSCNVLYDSQMLVIGGIAEHNSSLPCDEPAIGNQHALQLDLAGESTPWLAPLPTKTTYRVPPAITAVIGGGPSGSATVTSPANGWATSELSVYFQRTYTAVTRSPTRSLPSTATPTATSAVPTHSGTVNIGAIAGGAAAGGVVLIASVVLMACCCIRRRKRHASEQPTQAPIIQQMPPISPLNGTIEDYNHPRGAPSVTSDGSLSPRVSPPPPWVQGFSPSSQESKWQAIPQPLVKPLPPDHRQTYYPPPPDPQRDDEVRIMHEMPGFRSPIQLEGVPSQPASHGQRAT